MNDSAAGRSNKLLLIIHTEKFTLIMSIFRETFFRFLLLLLSADACRFCQAFQPPA